MVTPSEPVLLPPNAFDHFYRGGANIADLRGNEPGERRPEEWLGSTVARWGEPENGLTRIGDRTLKAIIADDPNGWLGADHVRRFGADPAVLVKLLDAGQRLPVHVHPTRRFAGRHLDCPYGKTEAWVVLDGGDDSGTVFIGTRRPVDQREWAELVEAQATEEMLELLVPIEVSVGDAIVVPSGTPHCTGQGLFVLELQEPTDFSLLLEWKGFAVDGRSDGHLDLGFDTALGMVRPDALDDDGIETLVNRHRERSPIAPGQPARSLMPTVADPYFRAWQLAAGSETPVAVPGGFGILLITEGDGALLVGDHHHPLHRGQAWVVPDGARHRRIAGPVTALFAQGPAPDAPEPIEWDHE